MPCPPIHARRTVVGLRRYLYPSHQRYRVCEGLPTVWNGVRSPWEGEAMSLSPQERRVLDLIATGLSGGASRTRHR